MSDDETYETADAGSSHTFPTPAGDLKKGDHLCIKGFPCRIVDIATSKTGKHGHAKANITALDVFTGKKYEEVAPTSHSLPCPFVVKTEYQLLDIGANGNLTVLDDDNNERSDFNLPPDEELAARIKEAFAGGKELQIIVQKAMGIEQVVSIKEPGGAKT